MHDLHATGSSDIHRQTFENLKRAVTLKVDFEGVSGDYEHLK